jgi:hypothetical protein
VNTPTRSYSSWITRDSEVSGRLTVRIADDLSGVAHIPGTGLVAQRGNYVARNEWRGMKLTISTEPDTVEAVR